MVQFIEKEFKSILNVRKYIDGWFWDKYTLSGYNGCQFGCIYCDSRSAKYNMPVDFENDIVVKKNAGAMLEKRISNARTLLPDVVAMSGGCDPFQPAERKFGNTRQCLEVLNKYSFPVHILTKSTLVLEELELLDEIAKKTWCTISFTITTINDSVARFAETRVPLPRERLKCIEQIKKEHPAIQTGILLMPLIPFLSDSDYDIEDLVKAAKDAGADYLVFSGGMTMRDMQALWFMKHLSAAHPQLVHEYEKLYRFSYNSEKYTGEYGTTSAYYNEKNRKILNACIKYEMPFLIKRFIPNDFRKANYILTEKIFAETFIKHIESRPDEQLYWAAMHIQNLKESIHSIVKRDELNSINNINQDIKQRIIRELESIPDYSNQQTRLNF